MSFTFDLLTKRFLATLIVFIILITQASYNLVMYFIGYTFKSKVKILKTKLSFDNLFSNFLIRLSTIVLIVVFTLPTLSQDPLVPITHTYSLNTLYINDILMAIISVLIILLFIHVDVIVIGYLLKHYTIKKTLHQLKLKTISIPDNQIPEKITKEYINKSLFATIKKNK